MSLLLPDSGLLFWMLLSFGVVFVEEIVVYAKDRVEIKWKFRDEFGEVGKVEKDRTFGREYGNEVV